MDKTALRPARATPANVETNVIVVMAALVRNAKSVNALVTVANVAKVAQAKSPAPVTLHVAANSCITSSHKGWGGKPLILIFVIMHDNLFHVIELLTVTVPILWQAK